MLFVKKLLPIVLLTLTCSSMAQNNESVTFNPHWYLQLQGGASHTLGEAKFSKLISPAIAGNIGYKFNPVFGLRAGVSGWQAKGGWVSPKTDYKFNYVQGNIDATFDLSNLICGFNPKRFFNGYGFIGGAFNHAFKNDEANDLVKQGYDLRYIWDGSKNLIAGRAGLGTDLRLSDIVSFNIELNANILSDKYNSKKAGNPDWQFNLLGGFTINLGKSYKSNKEPIVYNNASQETPAPVKEEPAVVETPVQKEVVDEAIKEDIFYTIGSSKIADNEYTKVDKIVSYLNKYPESTVTLTGYADKGTGTQKVNMRISKKRAETVAELLASKGISKDRIHIDYKGDTVQPFSENDDNRVTMCITK